MTTLNIYFNWTSVSASSTKVKAHKANSNQHSSISCCRMVAELRRSLVGSVTFSNDDFTIASAHIGRHSKHSVVHFSKPSSLPFNGAPHYVFPPSVQLHFTTFTASRWAMEKAGDFWLRFRLSCSFVVCLSVDKRLCSAEKSEHNFLPTAEPPSECMPTNSSNRVNAKESARKA